MRAPLPFTLSVVVSLIGGGVQASASETRELESHEHGHAKMQIAMENNIINIEVDVPGESIVGFEHAAKTDEQKAAVAAAIKQLSDADAVFKLPSAAGCKVASADVELHQEGDHNAFEAAYQFTCSNLAAATSLETNLFVLYPSIEEIDVDYIATSGQGSGELEAGSPVLSFGSGS